MYTIKKERFAKTGYTLIEILVALAILALVATFLFGGLASFYKHIQLKGTVENIVAMFEEARKNTLSSYQLSQYGVHLEADTITRFKGVTYLSNDPDNVVYIIGPTVEVVNIALNGSGSDVIFKRLNGETDEYGTLVVRLKNNPSQARTIEVYRSGLVEVD